MRIYTRKLKYTPEKYTPYIHPNGTKVDTDSKKYKKYAQYTGIRQTKKHNILYHKRYCT